MATTVVKTIGNGTRDYTSIQAWDDAAPANLVSSDQIWEGQLYREGSGTDGEWTATVTIGGSTSDSTRYKKLTCASGESFKDNANKLTNALRYNPANGVAIRCTGAYDQAGVVLNEAYAKLIGLQISGNTSKNAVKDNGGGYFSIQNCILKSSGAAAYTGWNTGTVVANCLLESSGSYGAVSGYNSLSVFGCTLIHCGTAASAFTSGAYSSNNTVFKDCSIFGFNSASTGYSSSSSYNATDLSLLGGTNNKTSLTASSQFESVSSSSALDARAKSGNGLQYGITDSTWLTYDIVGQTRAGTPTIGAWEYVSSGAVTHDTSGALTGQGSSIAGTAAHIAVHATSGALAGQGSSVVGTAAHIVVHATSGVLSGQGSSISGASARFRAFGTSGALTGQGSEVVGAAARSAAGVHDTSGALTGQGSTINGTAAHIAVHGASGVLVGPGAEIIGVAARVAAAVTHDTSGDLTGLGAAVNGDFIHSGAGAESGKVGGDDVPEERVEIWEKYKKRRNRDDALEAAVVKAFKEITGQVEPEEVKEIKQEVKKELPKPETFDYSGVNEWLQAQDALIRRLIEQEIEDDDEEVLMLLAA